MKRSFSVAGVLGAAAIALLASATPASASSSIEEPADCSTTSTAVFGTVTVHMTCTGRPAGQQWQEVIWCNPRGSEGGDSHWYGDIVTGNGTSTTGCTILSSQGFMDVYFSDSNLQPKGHQPG